MIWLFACGEPPAPPLPPPDLVLEAPLSPGGAPMRLEVRAGNIASLGPASGVVGGLPADLITAGFVDAHGHVEGLGKALLSLDLMDAPSYADTLARVAGAAPGDGWLTGRGWDQNDWADAPDGGWPLATDLDALFPGRPVALTRVDGHAIWLSSAALVASGVTRDAVDPIGGRILRDARGEPTGVLVDNAVELVKIPDPTPAERERRIAKAVDAIRGVGLTGVHDMGTSDGALAVLEQLDRDGALPIRVWCYLDPSSKAAERLYTSGPWSGKHVSVVGIKAYADGALGSRGALLSTPYADEPDRTGLAVAAAEDLKTLAEKTLGAGGAVAIHGIGDQGVHNALDAFEAARAAHPDRADVRLRVEHAQVVRPDDVERFAKLGVIASMQPTHATSDMPWAEARLGPERVRWAYTWRTLADADAHLAFGSDFPVESHDPSLGLWSATTRQDLAGNPPEGWYPDQRVTFDEAVLAFTAGSAYAVREQERLGEIGEGRTADLTLWRQEGARWRAITTIVDGVVVWP